MCNTLTTLETLASRLVCPVPGLHPPTVRNLNLVLGWNQRVWDKVSSVSRAFFDVIALHLRPKLFPVFSTITSLTFGMSSGRMSYLVRSILALPMPHLQTLAIWEQEIEGQYWIDTESVAIITQATLAGCTGSLTNVALSVLRLSGDMIPAFQKVTNLLIAEDLLLPLGENHTSRRATLRGLFPMLIEFKSSEGLSEQDIDQWKCHL